MKKAIVYVACILLAVSSFAAEPGSKVVQRFTETFPNAKNIKWRDDKAGYFVSFTQNGNFNKAFYNSGGEFVYSLKYSGAETLPTNIIMALNNKFGESKILGVTEITSQAGTAYNVKLSKEEKLYSLNVSTEGTILNQDDFVSAK